MIRNTPEVKMLNKERIRREIQNQEICTKAGVARATGLSIATCGNILNEMVSEEEIMETDQEEPTMGRPAKQYIYNKDFRHVIGMYLLEKGNVGEIHYTVADALGHVLKEDCVQVAEVTFDTVAEILEKELGEDDLIQNVTMGIPGIARNGIIEGCDVETLNGVPMVELIGEKFDIHAEVQNDMYFLSVGAYERIERKSRNIATVYFPDPGDGCVGCGLIVNGTVVQGFTKFSGELQYALEAFGLSKAEQEKRLDDRDAFCDMISKVTIMICTVIDPEVIMVMGNGVNRADLDVAKTKTLEIINEEHIPRLITDEENYIYDYYRDGLIKIALDRMQFAVSMREGML